MGEQPKMPSRAVLQRCREILIEESAKYGIAPAYVVAHVRMTRANVARREVQQRMISELGMRRHVVAYFFGRDLRRVRASVLSKPARAIVPAAPKRRGKKGRFDMVRGQLIWKFAAERTNPRRPQDRQAAVEPASCPVIADSSQGQFYFA
jgi:hypothetical protein